MRYYEHKTEDGFVYKNEDIYGIINLYSKEKLDAKSLDQLVMIILKGNASQGEINNVRFEYKGTNTWREERETGSAL